MTGYIIKVNIISPYRTSMEFLDFSLDFYVERERVQHYEKAELIKVRNGENNDYYARIDSNWLRRGHLICKASIVDPEPLWENRERPVVVTGYTGITIGLCNYRETNRVTCMDYTLEFVQVEDIPKNDGLRVFYGATDAFLTSITQEVANRLNQLPLGKYESLPVGITEGDCIVVLLPYEEEYTAMKSNGLGQPVTFDTSIQGANGDIETIVDGVRYKVYGEFMTINGIINVIVS